MAACKACVSFVVCPVLAFSAGCASPAAIQAKVNSIEQRHGGTVVATNPLSRCYLFGNLPRLLDRIDRDLERTPQFFKDNMGPVLIEESLLDNPATYPFPFLIRGYVDPNEEGRGFPVHVKNRSWLQKVVFFAPRDDELFLHEASHSFEFAIYTRHRDAWLAFLEEFEAAGGVSYLPSHIGPVAYSTVVSLMPPVGYLRVRGMPSLYGWLNHFEDFAETHCFLQRHGGEVEFLRDHDPALFSKCKAAARFVEGGHLEEAQLSPEPMDGP
ncbi:MAG: hypothetical protein KAX19_01375, partial [Candidatus Brocadiae bacterium]|nr:hypothetical protein [Candidatus Brocadiia bacterium]